MENNHIGLIIAAILLVVIFSLLLVDIASPSYGFFAKVGVGHVGVVEHFGKVREQTLQPGFHITGYFEHVRCVDTRTQRHNYTMEAFSSDIQQVILQVAVNENVSPNSAYKLYTTVGMNYLENLLEPRLQENTKIVISKYTAESLISNRETLSSKILERMQSDMEQYGINVSTISIENIDFTDSYEAAIEAKQVATQEKQRAKTLQEQATMEAQQAAERDRIKAEAEANIKKINAEAEAYSSQLKADAEAYAIAAKTKAEAEGNKQISESLTDKLINYTQAQRWDGKLPQFSGNALPFINVPITQPEN